MMQIEQLVLEHAKNHSEAEITDFVKLLYQSAFGGGHMIANEQAALERLRAELSSLTAAQLEQPVTEPLGGKYCRLNLSACKMASPKLINRVFVVSAKPVDDVARAEFEAYTEVLKQACSEHSEMFSFTAGEVERYLVEYGAQDYAPVSHSESYRAAYLPAYRVVRTELAQLLPLLAATENRLRKSGSVTVAIDGCCGAGKSTAAEWFKAVFDCNVFHADDFFLPPEKRTPERSNEVGGNMERERLKAEICEPLKRGEAFEYRPFDCSAMALAQPVKIKPKKVNVIEGSYSMHPDLREYYDLSAFMTVEPEEQLRRIAARSGEKLLLRFKEEWIPKENTYFEQMRVKEACNFVF